MLIDFRVANHRSVRDEQVLTMASSAIGEADDARPRRVPGHSKALLPVAGVYGANASGKSNFIAALAFMRDSVLHSHRTWEPQGGIPREPFAWGATTSQPSIYEVSALVNGVRYQYGFVANDEQFVEEWLYAWPHGRKQTWFTRDDGKFSFGEAFRGENRVVEQVTRPNALFLSAAVQHRHEQLLPLHYWFLRLRSYGSAFWTRTRFRPEFFPMRWVEKALTGESAPGRQRSLFEEEDPREQDPAEMATSLRVLLQAADVGIVDLRLEPEIDSQRRSRSRISFGHRNAGGEPVWLPLHEESNGTITLFNLAPYILDSLQNGGVLLVDELEATLHPLLALQVVSLFNDPATNPHAAQLIFTTHNTHLLGRVLGEPVLRRDQVWLTEKDPEGATCIYPLTSYKPRRAENVERGYLQGRYGAIPFLSELVVAEIE